MNYQENNVILMEENQPIMKFTPPECLQCKSRKSSLFHFCNLEEVENLNTAKTCASYKKGQTIFVEGANPFGLFCINTGKVKIYKYAADGKEQIVRIVKPGDLLGYNSLLSSTRYTVSAAALEDCVICLVPKTDITKLFKENERFSEGLINLLCNTIDESVEKMADMAYKPVRGRMAEALLWLYQAYKDESNPDGVININREDLASLVGTVKETAIRVLKEFKDDELIRAVNSDIIVLNPKGLAAVSGLYD